MEVFFRWSDAKYCIYMKCSSSLTGPMARVLSCVMMKTKTTKHVTRRCFQKTHQDLFLLQPTTGSACQEITLPNKGPFLSDSPMIHYFVTRSVSLLNTMLTNRLYLRSSFERTKPKTGKVRGKLSKDLIRPPSVVFINENRIKCKRQILKEL